MDASLLSRLNIQRLSANLGAQPAFINEMLTIYITVAREALAIMENAERSHNVISWLQTAHNLKGASLNITAKRLASLCIEAEQIQSLPHAQSSATLYHLHKELALVQLEITKALESDIG